MGKKDGIAKFGRPADGDGRKEMKKITFRVDDETFEMIQVLMKRLQGIIGTHVRGVRSVLLRRLILSALENDKELSD